MKTGEGSKDKSLQGFVSHVKKFGFYPKSIGDHLRVLRNSENGSKEIAELEATITMRSDSSQNQEGGETERSGQSQEEFKDLINEMWLQIQCRERRRKWCPRFLPWVTEWVDGDTVH